MVEAQLKRHEPLYLKHRPQALDQLVGQHAVTRTLTNAINHDRISHAYLFTGPRGTGKTSSARILAKSLNCKASDKPTASPCLQCTACTEIKQGTSPAVFELDAASNNSVDDARVLIERAPLVAAGGRFKVYIIDECHMLTKEAFNALLKTIEDPPPNVVFVLATTEEHKVIPTIVSRCQRLMFRLVTQEDLVAHLRSVANVEKIEITDDALAYIARRSGGGLRDALGLLDQASLLSAPGKPVSVSELLGLLGALHEDTLLEISKHVQQRAGQLVLQCANKLLQEGREPSIVAQELARHFLNLMKASYVSDQSDGNETASQLIIGSPGYVSGLMQQAPLYERAELSQIVEVLDRLEQTCRRTTQPAMHLEVGLLSLCHRHDIVVMHDLLDRVARLEQGVAPQSASRPAASAPSGSPAVSGAAAAGAPGAAAYGARPSSPSSTGAMSAPQVQPPPPIATTPSSDEDEVLELDPPDDEADDMAVEPALPAVPRFDSPSEVQPVAPSVVPAPVSPVADKPSPSPAAIPSPVVADKPSPSSAAAPTPTGGGNEVVDAIQLDHIWSQTLEELQRRHLPTYSLASMHAFPLSMSASEFSLGVNSETFQKMLEPKVQHIKDACLAATGKTLHIKVRVASKDLAAAKPRPRDTATAKRAPESPPDFDDEEPGEPADWNSQSEPFTEAAASTQNAAAALPPPASPPFPAPAERSVPVPDQRAVSAPEHGQSDVRAAMKAAEARAGAERPNGAVPSNQHAHDGSLVKEAYRLFEGPGSRLVGDKE